jgi:hypothetical protein
VDYRAALRGDGQKIVEVVPAETQRRALKLLMTTITPEALALPRSLIKLMPPRSGVRGGETFPRRTSPTFDPLSPAETAADLTISLLLNPNRAARLLANRALDEKAPTLEEVIDMLVSSTWKAVLPADPYLAEIHRVVDTAALQHLMALASDAQASAQVRAVASYRIDQLKSWLKTQAPQDASESAHFVFAVAEIERYQADPGKFVVPKLVPIPPGAPIGMEEAPLPGIVRHWGDERKFCPQER